MKISKYAVMVTLLGVWSSVGEGAEEAWTLGKQIVGVESRHVFHVGDADGRGWRIGGVEPSCECLTVERWTRDVPKGGGGEIVLKHLAGEGGEMEYEVEVTGTDDEGNEIRQTYPLRAVVKATDDDSDLYPEEEAVKRVLKDPFSTLIVDVRGEEAFRKGHVPGAVEVPLFAIKGKVYLLDREIWVMDAGWGRAAGREVRRLKEEGHDAKLWMGGLVAWRDMGGRVEGEGPFDADKIPSEGVDQVAEAKEWLLVDASSGEGAGVLPPGAIRIEYVTGEEEAFAAALDQELERTDKLFVMIGTLSGQDGADLIHPKCRNACGVFHLQGGWLGWGEWKALMERAKKARVQIERENTKRTKCKACAKKP